MKSEQSDYEHDVAYDDHNEEMEEITGILKFPLLPDEDPEYPRPLDRYGVHLDTALESNTYDQ